MKRNKSSGLCVSGAFLKKRRTDISTSTKPTQNECVPSIHSSLEHYSNDSSEAHGSEVRVAASSKVNFSKLSAEEQRFRYINQTLKVQKLNDQLKGLLKTKGKRVNKTLKKAQEKLRSARHESEDLKYLLDNILKAIIEGKLVPNTLSYCQIYTILRDILKVPIEEGSCIAVSYTHLTLPTICSV
eukprot:TRINITY_DN10398_c0_g2_i8.p1 TRINITY_DN10398_c0_g2~~TRINITY_DN10398_c0_g2_i8.p1  ORF type:complete len:185 (-),score=39.68 TRINITY_DN10398_c0_g2_i8:17-571(-)